MRSPQNRGDLRKVKNMLTAILTFLILGWICWKLSKFCKRIASNLREVAESESYYKQTLLEAAQDVRDNVCPEEEEVDVAAELREINDGLKAREEQKRRDREAIEQLIVDTDPEQI